jgi:hypothetical protein
MRTNSVRISLLIGLASLAVTPGTRADSLTFSAIPSAVSGPAGTTVGWGYSITNTSATDYLDITAIDSDLFLATDGTPDASIFNFPNLAPGQTVTQVYDPVDSVGLFQFTWNAGLPDGTEESGVFTLYGAFCVPTDPFCADDLSVSATTLATTPYSATVVSNSSISATEPSGFSLAAILMAVVGIAGQRIYSARRAWIGSAAMARRAGR